MEQQMTQKNSKTDKHPSGLSWERWEFPFKTLEERIMIQDWLANKPNNWHLDSTNPF